MAVALLKLHRLRSTFHPEAVDGLVSRFYARVREDEVLGPIFEERISDWPFHLARMRTFWGSVLRGEPGYEADHRGSPVAIHRAIAGLTPEHFSRWLDLFEDTAHELFEPWAAENVVGRARRMAVALSSPSLAR